MDATRFDALTKALATGTSRRWLFRGLTGGVSAVGLGLVGQQSAAAFICRKDGVLCAKDAHCCSGSCVNHHCAASSFCAAGGDSCAVATGGTLCQGGTCSCASDVDGSNVCVDPSGSCLSCTSDVDCEKQLGVTGAACVVALCCDGLTTCAFRC